MKNALNNQEGMLGDMFLWLVANLKQGVIYFIKQALPPNISAGSVPTSYSQILHAHPLGIRLIKSLGKVEVFFIGVANSCFF